MSVPDFRTPELDPAPCSCSCLPCWRAVNLKEPRAACLQIRSQGAAVMHVAVNAWRRFGLFTPCFHSCQPLIALCSLLLITVLPDIGLFVLNDNMNADLTVKAQTFSLRGSCSMMLASSSNSALTCF